MHKKIVATVLIFVVSALSFGVQAEWVSYSPDGRFSILLPHAPSVDKVTDADVITYTFMSVEPGIAFTGAYTDLALIDADRDELLDVARDRFIRETGPMAGSEQKITLDGHPGREFEVTITQPDKPVMSVRMRIYLVEKRVYSLAYISKKGSDAKVNADKMARFFSSFKVIPAH